MALSVQCQIHKVTRTVLPPKNTLDKQILYLFQELENKAVHYIRIFSYQDIQVFDDYLHVYNHIVEQLGVHTHMLTLQMNFSFKTLVKGLAASVVRLVNVVTDTRDHIYYLGDVAKMVGIPLHIMKELELTILKCLDYQLHPPNMLTIQDDV